MSTFTWPWQYSFPPFFTLQPNVETRRRQLEAWASLVLKYAEEKKISQLVVLDAQQCELFHNVKLNRKLNLDGITSVLDCLRDKEKLVFERRSLNVSITLAFAWNALSRVIWLDKQRSRCRIYWKSPAEWAELVYDWASRLGFRGTVCTLYEITHGPDSAGEFSVVFNSFLPTFWQHLNALAVIESNPLFLPGNDCHRMAFATTPAVNGKC
ncbi:hypothetical protein M514_06173 [Trichuris suis]|uniref:Vacuolar protein-sorting-associated protein 25 n=1 Tax=Trichuris suis TaxID=68888 RepID=A0A085NFF4_9BILA|nr:hypothetical protein M514_06173 [Trichuris suis]